MILTNTELKKFCSNITNKNLPNNFFYLIEQLTTKYKHNSLNAITQQISEDESFMVCVSLAKKLLQYWNPDQILLCDLKSEEKIDNNVFLEIIKKFVHQNKKNTFIIINAANNLKGTNLWIRHFHKLVKQYKVKVYLFFNEIGFFYTNLYQRYKISHFYLETEKFVDYLKIHKKNKNIDLKDYINFLMWKINNHEKNNESLSIEIIKKISAIIKHDAYELYEKIFSIHTCLDLMRYIAYAYEPLFDLEKTAEILKINLQDLMQIINILEKARLIRCLTLINRDIKKTLNHYVYLVFYDPIYYFAYDDSVKDITNDLRFWTSILINAYNMDELNVVQDIYIPLINQIGIFNADKNIFLQMGLENKSIGPLMNYLHSTNVHKVHYFTLNQLINFVVNWQLKNAKKIKLE